jgi:hypothetical protein
MRTLQLCGAILLVATTVACNRSESDVNARRAADKVGVAAARAGDQLADSWLTTKIQAQYFADDDIKARHINSTTRKSPPACSRSSSPTTASRARASPSRPEAASSR